MGGAGFDKSTGKWGLGDLEFEALMRTLDNAGYRTGYIYRQPLVKEEPPKPKNEVELPPAVSSLGYLLEEENLYKDGPLRALLGSYVKAQKGAGRTKWMNSPANLYQKVEILETATPDPKKITFLIYRLHIFYCFFIKIYGRLWLNLSEHQVP